MRECLMHLLRKIYPSIIIKLNGKDDKREYLRVYHYYKRDKKCCLLLRFSLKPNFVGLSWSLSIHIIEIKWHKLGGLENSCSSPMTLKLTKVCHCGWEDVMKLFSLLDPRIKLCYGECTRDKWESLNERCIVSMRIWLLKVVLCTHTHI